MNGDALNVSDRLRGVTDAKRKSFVCPATAATASAPLPAETE